MLVTSAGGVEEDFVKCLAPFWVGDFSKWEGSELRKLGINRTGNLLVPNDNYCSLETWLLPIFDQLLKEQDEQVCTSFALFELGDLLPALPHECRLHVF